MSSSSFLSLERRRNLQTKKSKSRLRNWKKRKSKKAKTLNKQNPFRDIADKKTGR